MPSFLRCFRCVEVGLLDESGIAGMSDIKLVANLADRLARRILEGVESGTFTADELRGSPDVVLVTNAAMLLQREGAEFPPDLRRLAENDAASRARVVRQALGAVRDSLAV